MKRGLLIITFVLVIALGFFHQIGSAFYFYWDTVWFDNMMHFLGGATIGLLFLWTWFASGMFGRRAPSQREAFACAFLTFFIVATGWEFFEYVYDIANPVGSYKVDTFQDYVFGLLGASIAGLIGRVRAFYE